VHQAGEPSPFLLRHLAALRRGRALDLACGAGRHALLLARHGFQVDAVDRDPGALAVLAAAARTEGLAVRPLAADLETFPLPEAVWDLVLDVRYLQRSLAPAIAAALRPGGLLVFETFTVEQARLGRPRNPDFLLRPGELSRMFPGLKTLAFEEEVRDGREAVAALLARKP
jgi:SAM-dependent methyltransferase